MWEELTQRLEGKLIVLEPIREEHREPLRAAADVTGSGGGWTANNARQSGSSAPRRRLARKPK